MVLPDTDIADVELAAQSLVARVAATMFPVVGHVTISCGVSVLHEAARDDLTLYRADRALYRAKKDGRNRAVRYDTELDA